MFDQLAHGMPGAGGEIQLTDGMAATVGEDDVFACEFVGEHCDAGEPKGLLSGHPARVEVRPGPKGNGSRRRRRLVAGGL